MASVGDQLPIHDALPALKLALAENSAAVLVAPPGAGKTTVTPLALMDEAWTAGGKLIVLEPRRLAARAAAERMAATLGERVGERVGYRVRLASRVSARTRIEVVTEGVFTRMIQADPGLEGVAAVLFDEFHERSLDADLGLAFARDAQALIRPDLRLAVMSATLDLGPGRRAAGRRAGDREPGPHVPGRDPLPRPRPGAQDRGPDRPRRCQCAGAGDRLAAGLPARPGRDRPRRRAPCRARDRPRRRDRAALWRADAGHAGPRHCAGADRPPQGGARHLDRPNQPHHRGRAGGDRRRAVARAALRAGERPDAASTLSGSRPRRPTSGGAGRDAPSPASATGSGTSERPAVSSPSTAPKSWRPILPASPSTSRSGAPAMARASPSSTGRRRPRWPRLARCCSASPRWMGQAL